MKPCLYIHKTIEGDAGPHDLTPYILPLKPVRNDLDAEGSGRDVVDGYFYRERIAQKVTINVNFIDLDEHQMAFIASLFDDQYTTATYLDPKTNSYVQSQFYVSSFDYGTQLWQRHGREDRRQCCDDGKCIYIGASLTLRER